jgi:L-asparaginase
MQTYARYCFPLLILSGLFLAFTARGEAKPTIAVFSGSMPTIQNSEPLVTSNKARTKYDLPVLQNPDGSYFKYDHLVPQRLAAPIEVLIEAYSAHPLEKDAAELNAPPDGYVDKAGHFELKRHNPDDIPVYKAILRPEDGLYMLPYMTRQADGSAWEEDCTQPKAPEDQCRQPFFPDASRLFEEVDRGIFGVSEQGLANMLSSKADYDFYRAVPPAGYRKGLPASERTDFGDGDIPPEVAGEDFFAYRPSHLWKSTRFHDIARSSNTVQKALNSGNYLGAIWLEGSPFVEESIYWLNLLVDTPVPIVGNAAQRAGRALSADGPRNIVDAVDFIMSKQWAGRDGKNELGAVLIQSEQIFAARQAQKSDARIGGYIATGDHGGILGTIGKPGPVTIYFKPQAHHTWRSEVKLTKLLSRVKGVRIQNGELMTLDVRIKDDDGWLRGEAIPKVTIVKLGQYSQQSSDAEPDGEVGIMAWLEKYLREFPLAGFVAEGTAPYGTMNQAQENALEIAAFSGIPTVRVGRGNAGGVSAVRLSNVVIEGNNLTATKARLLLKACLMKFGSLPFARDPRKPTKTEREAVQTEIARYQQIFNTH